MGKYGVTSKLVWDGGDKILIPEEMGKPRADQLQGTVREQLSELAGRVCYDSVGSGRSSPDYHKHIQEVGHLSVYEHAHLTVQVRLPLEAMVFLNRPGLWVENRFEEGFRVTFNPRNILDWDMWSGQIGVDDLVKEQSSFKIGDVLSYHAEQAYPMMVAPRSRDGERVAGYKQLTQVVEPETDEEKWVSMFMVGSRGFCYDAETEVLTSDGWKKWPDVSGNEKFASLNVSSGIMEFQEASAIVRDPYHGRMYRVSSQCVDMFVTPNHRMVVKLFDTQAGKRGEEVFQVLTAEEVAGRRIQYKRTAKWIGSCPKFFDIPEVSVKAENVNHVGSFGTRTIVSNGRRVKALCFARFLGYWLAEGCLDHQPGAGYSTTLYQNRGGKAWDGIHECLNDLGFTFNETENKAGCVKLRVNGGRALHDYLKPYSLAENKGIPDEIKNWGPEYQCAIIDAYLEGDGSKGAGRHAGEGHTVSQRLANDLQEAALKAGFSASIRVVDRRNDPPRKWKWAAIKSTRLIYVVGFSKHRGSEPLVNHGGKKHDSWERYSGMVYCATVPNGTLYVRRNGKPCWSGNSHELVRHGDRTGISQRSTRFVQENESPWVDHPLVQEFLASKDLLPDDPENRIRGALGAIIGDVKISAREVYERTVEHLQKWLTAKGVDKLTARKQARGAARGYLGNALLTELIFSASVGQWKRMLRMRACAPADAEIRAVFVQALEALKQSRYAADFSSFIVAPAPDGLGEIAVEEKS